jgi:hypothetical protein
MSLTPILTKVSIEELLLELESRIDDLREDLGKVKGNPGPRGERGLQGEPGVTEVRHVFQELPEDLITEEELEERLKGIEDNIRTLGTNLGNAQVFSASQIVLKTRKTTTDISLGDLGETVLLAEGTLTVKLPPSPKSTTRVHVKNKGTGVITVEGNGRLVEGTQVVCLTKQNTSIPFQFSKEFNEWIIL